MQLKVPAPVSNLFIPHLVLKSKSNVSLTEHYCETQL